MKLLLMIAGIFLGDEQIKRYIESNKEENKREEILHGKIIITKHHNKGAILNHLEDRQNIVLTASCIAFGGVVTLLGQSIVKGSNFLTKLGLTIITGGALSNLYDRIKRGYVIDYFIIPKKFLDKIIFNLSDWCIFVGGIITVMGSVFDRK